MFGPATLAVASNFIPGIWTVTFPFFLMLSSQAGGFGLPPYEATIKYLFSHSRYIKADVLSFPVRRPFVVSSKLGSPASDPSSHPFVIRNNWTCIELKSLIKK
jgi:hypothetical protein